MILIGVILAAMEKYSEHETSLENKSDHGSGLEAWSDLEMRGKKSEVTWENNQKDDVSQGTGHRECDGETVINKNENFGNSLKTKLPRSHVRGKVKHFVYRYHVAKINLN